MKSIAVIASTALLLAFVTGCDKCGSGKCFAQKAGEKVEDALKIKVSVEKQNPPKIELSEAAKLAGMTMNVAKPLPPDNGRLGLNAYILTSKSVSGQLLARALDKDGKEIGRSVSPVELGVDDARYFNFSFPSEMDSRRVEGFLIEYKN
jgi:hypothetical protein